MQAPIRYRRGIPFFCEKSETAFRKDIYERYDDMVVRQSSLHLADKLWGSYPMQAVLDFAQAYYSEQGLQHILEVGCGVGRWIGELAKKYPKAACWGIDYSYQMLKRAHEFWVLNEALSFDLSNRGFSESLKVEGHQLHNLQFGLAKAEQLPFDDNSQDLVLSSFLLDRLDDPAKGLEEMQRVLKTNGKLILITPLNFSLAAYWQAYYPPAKLRTLMETIGFQILAWEAAIIIEEPLDAHHNMVTWKCLGMVAEKR